MEARPGQRLSRGRQRGVTAGLGNRQLGRPPGLSTQPANVKHSPLTLVHITSFQREPGSIVKKIINGASGKSETN